MEITIAQPQLLKALELLSRISTKHVTLPVLQCVLISVKNNQVVFSATNLEIGIEISSPATVVEEGVIAIPSATLLQTIQLVTDKEITLKVEEGTLTIEGKQSQTQIKSIPHDEFPSIPQLETTGQTINRSLFSLGIKTVSFAASQSSIKPELGSINIHQKKEHTLTFVATDSFRLMEKTVPQKGVVFDEAIMVPQKNATELARVADLLEEDPELIVNENQCALRFTESGVYITSRLVTGSFPDYEQIIPKEYSTHSIVLKSDLTQAFKRSNVFLNKFLQVTMAVTKDSLTVTAHNGDVGATTESMLAKTDGEELTLSFNQHYLLDSLQHINDDSVDLNFAGLGRPLVMKGISDTTLRYLVMPMNK
ncbi:MAG: DNA polymerase III subunit beta [Patescibacteria group bacterium]